MQKKRFLKLPEYPGGKEEFRKYIQENLKYPEEALKYGIQGTVHISAEISDNGEVLDVHIDRGIGYGCDEEAIRLIRDCVFGGVKNKGVRVRSKKKFRIPFYGNTQPTNSLTQANVVYNFKPAEITLDKPAKLKENPPGKTVYTYTVNLDKEA